MEVLSGIVIGAVLHAVRSCQATDLSTQLQDDDEDRYRNRHDMAVPQALRIHAKKVTYSIILQV